MKVRVKLPPGAHVDRNGLVEAIRGSLTGDGSPWGLNPVPAIAQLEESLYAAGVADITRAWEETAALLGLPPGAPGAASGTGSGARLSLGKSLAERVGDAYWKENE